MCYLCFDFLVSGLWRIGGVPIKGMQGVLPWVSRKRHIEPDYSPIIKAGANLSSGS